MSRPLIGLCFGLILLPLLGAAPVSKIQSMLAKPKVLCGRFDQKKQLVGLKNVVRSSGRFCVVADKGVLWRTLQPFPNTLRLNRDEIVQLRGDQVALRLDAKHEPTVGLINTVLFALLAGDLGELEKLFEIHGSIQNNAWSVTLKAREPSLAKAVGSIALEGGAYVRRITIHEASGDHTSIDFAALETGDGAMNVDEAKLF
jgi:Outer membrane lipoprotein carrier protein LolA-like